MKSKGIQGSVRRLHLRKAAEEDLKLQDKCDKAIDDIESLIDKNQEEYDKQLLTLSSGFLAISMAFIKDIVHMEQAIHRGLLYGSFVTLSFCVLLVLASYQVSNEVQLKAKSFWENQRDGDRKKPFPYALAKWVRFLNILTGLVFLLGIVLSVSFVIINIHREATMTENRGPTPSEVVKKGANVKVPPQPAKQTPPSSPPSKK